MAGQRGSRTNCRWSRNCDYCCNGPGSRDRRHHVAMLRRRRSLIHLEPSPMFRFTIRDVLWLMVVVGTLTTWWIERRRTSLEHAKAEAVAAEKLGRLQKEVTLQNQVVKAQKSILKKR